MRNPTDRTRRATDIRWGSFVVLLAAVTTLAAAACAGGDSVRHTPTPGTPLEEPPTPEELDRIALQPLRVPELDTESPCPVTPADKVVPGLSSLAGRGPLFVTFGGPIRLSDYPQGPQKGFFAVKTVWAASDSYPGAATIRGTELRTGILLSFGTPDVASPAGSLRFPPGPTGNSTPGLPPGWRILVAPILVSIPGCYLIQFDGQGFSNHVVVEVVR